jgi:hypothetical protein
VSREDLPWIVFAILLLIGGFMIGRRFVAPESVAVSREPESGGRSFRQWFWENRSLDLVVQVGLIYVGALGIAALLPGNGEIEGDEDK